MACASVASPAVLSFSWNTSFSDRVMVSFKDSPAENVLTLCWGCFAFPFSQQKKQTVLSNGDVWERVSCKDSLTFLFASFGPSSCLLYLNVYVVLHYTDTIFLRYPNLLKTDQLFSLYFSYEYQTIVNKCNDNIPVLFFFQKSSVHSFLIAASVQCYFSLN